MIRKPEKGTYPEYFDRYIQLVPDEIDVLNYLEDQGKRFVAFLTTEVMPVSQFAYETGKWTSQEMLGHLSDTERILSYRAFFIARGDDQNLPGFEQDDYVRSGEFMNREFKDMIVEFSLLRSNTVQLFKTFPLPLYERKAKINGFDTALGAMPYIIAGHVAHHESVLNEIYLA